MDIEQLQLILEAAQAAGDGAYSVALIWIGLQFMKLFCGFILAAGGIYGTYRIFVGFMKSSTFKAKVQGVVGFVDTDSYHTSAKFFSWLDENNKKSSWRNHSIKN